MFPCQDFIFYQSRGVAPGRFARDARANDANQAILAEDADLQLGMVRGWQIFLSGILFEVPGGVDVCLLNELGMGGEYSRNMAGLTLRLGVPLTWWVSLTHFGTTFTQTLVEDIDFLYKGKTPLRGTLWSEKSLQRGGCSGWGWWRFRWRCGGCWGWWGRWLARRRSLEMPINCLSSPINSPFPRARMISNTWVEPISGDVPPGWAALTVSNRESPMKRRHLGIDSSCLNWVQVEWQPWCYWSAEYYLPWISMKGGLLRTQ